MSEFASGSARPTLHQVFFGHLGSPKVSVLDGWNESRGKRCALALVKQVPSFRIEGWSWRADARRPSLKAAPRFAIVRSQD